MVVELSEGPPAQISLLWSTNVLAGENPAEWSGTNAFSMLVTGMVSKTAFGLQSETIYYWTFMASNAGGVRWSAKQSYRTPAALAVASPPVSSGLALDLTASGVTYTNQQAGCHVVAGQRGSMRPLYQRMGDQ